MVFAGLFAVLLSAPVTEMMIPEGTILAVVLNETLNTARLQENDPILFSLAEDIRTAGRRGTVLLPRGSSVVGRVVMSERAGHFIGRSEMGIRVRQIITPTGEVYDGVSSKIVDFDKQKGQQGEVKANGAIQGPVHRKRDTFLLLFPPTTLFQLLATPKRGPDVILPVESRLYVKLMTPIFVETTTARASAAVTQLAPPPNPLPPPAPIPTPSASPFPGPIPFPQLTARAPAPVSPNAVEILVAPVALYPDAILRDLFRASTHPFEVAQASQWVHQPRDAGGSLPRSGYDESWDPSVKALTAYPELLQRLTADADWIMKLGVTFTAQPIDVLSAVQRLRTWAKTSNNQAGVTLATSRR